MLTTSKEEECQLVVVGCPFAVVGCADVVTRQNKAQHMKEKADQHTEHNKNAIFNIQKELIESKKIRIISLITLQQSLDNTHERLHTTEKELETVKNKFKNMY